MDVLGITYFSCVQTKNCTISVQFFDLFLLQRKVNVCLVTRCRQPGTSVFVSLL